MISLTEPRIGHIKIVFSKHQVLKVRGVLRSGSEEKRADVNWKKVTAPVLKAVELKLGSAA